MERNDLYVSRKPVPVERAKSHERFAIYAITIVIGFVVAMVAEGVLIANAMPPGNHVGFVNSVVTLAQLIVTVATLGAVGVQMRIAVRQLEQNERVARPDARQRQPLVRQEARQADAPSGGYSQE